MHVVEFQKRGLPHVHMLLILSPDDRLHTSDDVDKVIAAELPPDPLTFPDGTAKLQAIRLEELVLRHMVHKCSAACKDANGPCKKGFPKPFSETTLWDDNAFYPIYRRRPPSTVDSPLNTGRAIEHNGRIIDNSWIVPYSPYLLLRFEAHINVEACVSPTAAKYLFKYVTKGTDRAMILL